MSILNEKQLFNSKMTHFQTLIANWTIFRSTGTSLKCWRFFLDLPWLALNFCRNCLLNNFREIRIRNLEISGSKIFVKFWWPVLIENWTGLHRFKRSCYLPCLTNNSRFLMNADVVEISGSKIWNFGKFFGKFGNFRGGLN